MTKGQIIKKLKENGIRRTHSGKRLENAKTFEVIKLYAELAEDAVSL